MPEKYLKLDYHFHLIKYNHIQKTTRNSFPLPEPFRSTELPDYYYITYSFESGNLFSKFLNKVIGAKKWGLPPHI